MRGGKRAGAGRRKGAINKLASDIKALAQPYGPEALDVIVFTMRQGEKLADRLTAARELLDRGYGKPAQAIVGGGEGTPPVALQFIELVAVKAQ